MVARQAAAGNGAACSALIGRGALVGARTKGGGGATALHLAASRGHAGVIRALLAGGASASVSTKARELSCFSRACLPAQWVTHRTLFSHHTIAWTAGRRCKRGVCVRLLMATQDEKRTPLHLAAAGGHDQCVAALAAAGADLAARDVLGAAPLASAAAENRCATAKLLLEAGARLEADDYDGWTAQQTADFHNFDEVGSTRID